MNELKNFYESVFYESVGLKALYEVYLAFSNLANYKTHFSEISTSNRTIADDEQYLQELINKADSKLDDLPKIQIQKLQQTAFDALEVLIRDILYQLEKIVKRENVTNNNAFQNTVTNCENAINVLLQTIYNEIQRNNIQVTHRNGDPIQQNDFQLRYYLQLFNVNIAIRNKKNNDKRESSK